MAEPRAPYSAIVDRPPLKLPGGARVAVWVCINVEEWEFGAPMARALLPAPQGASVSDRRAISSAKVSRSIPCSR